ncbi:MAG: polysaccharide pyruvyl transferase family protein [Aphanothece saxicola GSE-SYN-MK-01-06B]|jgi:pyruvyl transferase EpsO|nr:polysaccharide pyruvyl transferase family protein [Aphanothece saxicola GSE-SYN-MK-01-06B]
MQDLGAQIDTILLPLIPRHRPIAIFDFPDHANVGDSAIWLGEMAFLRTHRLGPIIWIDTLSRQRHCLPELPADCLILIHGGGNLGDLWESNQSYREAVIWRYSGHTIIQFPQSVLFQSASSEQEWIRVCRSHSDLHLLVRDRESQARCGHLNGTGLHLCPDMALYLGSLPRPCEPSTELLYLLRSDKEKAGPDAPPTKPHPSVSQRVQDWMDEPESRLQQELHSLRGLQERIKQPGSRSHRIRNGLLAASKPLGLSHLGWDPLTLFLMMRQRRYTQVAEERVLRGCRLLSQGKVVVTDRLHAHLLCVMMGIPHIYLDNSYGKISSFSRTWETMGPDARPSSNLAAASVEAHHLLEGMETVVAQPV